jgi:hypothetical protein
VDLLSGSLYEFIAQNQIYQLRYDGV